MPRKRKLPDGMTERPGRRGYYADFRIGGRRIQKRLGSDFDAACSILNDLKARAERSEFGLLDNDYPIAELKAAYLKACEQEKRPATVEAYRRRLDDILGYLGAHKVGQITAAAVVAYRSHRLKAAGPGTVNTAVRALGTMLSWGADPARKLIGLNPLKGFTPLLHDHPKEGRALSDGEVARLLEHSPAPWRDIWYAYLVTGMREQEIMGLRFADIDGEAQEIIVRMHRAKGKRERRIPIEDGLGAILRRQAAEASRRQPGRGRTPAEVLRVEAGFSRDHVFVGRQNTRLGSRAAVYDAFMRCCKRARIEARTYDPEGRLVEHVDVHSLRRTFATNAIVNGVDPKTVQEILGHKTLRMTMELYARIKAGSKRQAVARLSYGQGATPPGHILPLDGAAGR